jgi:catechol 2,3-dioxygenase-like lactoylglutathione lyase family enzyme
VGILPKSSDFFRPDTRMKIRRIHHVQITVPKGQEPAAREFYCNFLGLTEIGKPDSLKSKGGFWIQIADQQIHIGTEEGVNRNVTKAHAAYEVDDVFAWRKKLEDHGIKTLDSDAIPGYDRFEFRDPFGNRVELIRPND